MKSGAYSLLFCLLFLPSAQCRSGPKGELQSFAELLPIMEGDTLINRKPAVAGAFYPGTRENLLKQVETLFSTAAPANKLKNIIAIIAPHAGYVYSGLVAASAYNQLSLVPYDNVFLIGSSHYNSFDGASIYNEGNFITPIGTARVNIPLAKKLIHDNPGLFLASPEAHEAEHSLEVQVPFLQYLYKDDLQIIPILLGTQKPVTCRKIASALSPYLNGHNLFVISTDFSHYPNYQNACTVDESTANAIVKNSSEIFMNTVEKNENSGMTNLATCICGWTSMLTFLAITENDPKIQYHKIKYMNSGDAANADKGRVVGYHAIVVTRDMENQLEKSTVSYELTESEKNLLLQTARSTIKNYLETNKILQISTEGIPEKLFAESGAFVTLTNKGNLRGCIGRFTVDMPLYKVVQEMAISAATRDYRFDHVSMKELDQIHIEISVLTPMRKITSIDEIELGKHGIYIKKGSNSGTFLPQVAKDTGWNLEEFLGHCSRDKAGIGWNGWKEAEIYVYEAYVFGEP